MPAQQSNALNPPFSVIVACFWQIQVRVAREIKRDKAQKILQIGREVVAIGNIV